MIRNLASRKPSEEIILSIKRLTILIRFEHSRRMQDGRQILWDSSRSNKLSVITLVYDKFS